jgi:hypothetical protein
MRWVAWACLLLFTVAGVEEASHFHSDLANSSNEQHCSLCIAAHSVARPAQVVNVVSTPTRCLDVLLLCGPLQPDSRAVLSDYIRPPPVV